MDTIANYIAREIGSGALIVILVEIGVFLVMIWILYAVIKNAVKNAIIAARNELNYTIRKALLESKADIDAGVKEILDYTPAAFSYVQPIIPDEKKKKE